MQLRVRLTLAIAATGLITSLAVAVGVRGALVAEEHTRFDGRLAAALGDVRRAIDRAALSDRATLDRICANEPAIDRAIAAAHARADADRHDDHGTPDAEGAALDLAAAQARASVAAATTRLGATIGLDAIWVVDARDGFILGAPVGERSAIGASDARKLRLATDRSPFVHLVSAGVDGAAAVARCAREERGQAVLVTALRPLDRAFFDRIAEDVRGVRLLALGDSPRPGEIERPLSLALGPGPNDEPTTTPAPMLLTVGVNEAALANAIARIDQVIVFATLISILFGAFVGFMVARRLVSPLGVLANEARKVVEGTAVPVEVRGSDEVAALASAFNAMLDGLEATRRSLHAAERVAAWREAARRIAHEIKNPLAPIRASIETLRRLRARDDPAFDGYFDEATKTVLQEVRRVATIVDEFARYARIAPPRPTDIDPVEVGRHVVGLFTNVAGADADATGSTSDAEPRLALVSSPCGSLRADREQLVQVLVNLVKNALESTRARDGKPAGHVRVEVEPGGPEAVRFVVRDDGPGVDAAIVPRLFEPYASNKRGGTGLGLAIAQRIAVEHGGAIAYAKGPKGGAVFRLLLPRLGPAGAPPSEERLLPRPVAAQSDDAPRSSSGNGSA